MVRTKGPDDYERLDRLVHETAAAHQLRVDTTGWTRKTYDITWAEHPRDPRKTLARVESFATTNGEILVFDDRALPFAEALGAALEAAFPIGEATIVRRV